MIARSTPFHPQNYNALNSNEYNGDNQALKNAAYDNRMNCNFKNVQTTRGPHETVLRYDMSRFVPPFFLFFAQPFFLYFVVY